MTSRNPLDPYAYSYEAMPHTIGGRVVPDDLKLGVHVTTRLETAVVYAVNKASITEDSIGIIVAIDTEGLLPFPDLDAEVTANYNRWVINDLLDSSSVAEAVESGSVEDLLDGVDVFFEDFDYSVNDTPLGMEWKPAAYETLSRKSLFNVQSVLFNLQPEELLEALQQHSRTGQMPLWVWALIVEQSRYKEPIGLDRIVEVRALHPINLDLVGSPKYVDDPSLESFEDTDFYEDTWLPSSKVIWGRGYSSSEVKYHGTDLNRFSIAIPELSLQNPFDASQPLDL